jgi:hypothetical protein
VKVDSWKDFLKSPKCVGVRKKLKKYESKYRMFHDIPSGCASLDDGLVMEGIDSLMGLLEGESNYKARLVVGADYLTTLYQLLHLRRKYEPAEFMRLSKIDLIMQGNPYNTNADHLDKLRKKLLLIRP